ncbi:hypothetical protein SCLCIDRAFT_11135 [Scleroderma citrinum Foug A]|uniref:Uncharacterized protein n=1 Tax=Scleroderma citrinum Foug A TaxID=1036808 RepID=A0A0C3DFP1_9AGAM|nr:hypothetical protein SCLCIDRAFT_11135 [Scleroderma citrinum Foug A]
MMDDQIFPRIGREFHPQGRKGVLQEGAFQATEELSVNYQHIESFHLATNCMNTKTGLGRKVWMRTRYYVTVDGRQTYWDTIVDLKEGDRFVHVSGLVSISVE